jgi:FixJ family two-component response regulator
MNGLTLSIEAAALRPDLSVLFTTGYARNAIIHDGRLDPGVQFLAKPYTQEELAHKVRAFIDSSAKACSASAPSLQSAQQLERVRPPVVLADAGNAPELAEPFSRTGL